MQTLLRRHVIACALVVAAMAVSTSPSAHAQPKPAEPPPRPMTLREREAAAGKYKPGQHVEGKRFNQWLPATVVRIERGGRVRVKFAKDGVEFPLAPEDLRSSAAPAGAE